MTAAGTTDARPVAVHLEQVQTENTPQCMDITASAVTKATSAEHSYNSRSMSYV